MMFCQHVCSCTMCMFYAGRGENRASDLLEMELQIGVSCHVRAENQAKFSGKSASAVNHQVISPGSILIV